MYDCIQSYINNFALYYRKGQGDGYGEQKGISRQTFEFIAA